MEMPPSQLFCIWKCPKYNRIGIDYELVKEAYKTQQPFKVIKLGKLYRIPKKPFDDWLEGNT